MKPLLFLLLAGCAFGQGAKSARKMPSCTYSGVEVSGDLRTNCAPKSMGQKPAMVEWQIVDTNTANTPQADRIDVPAIQETRKVPKGQCRIPTPATGFGTFTNCLPEEQVVTCADKTRILEHDEQDPPKYYCRKVQP